jgi:hypothetical protein
MLVWMVSIRIRARRITSASIIGFSASEAIGAAPDGALMMFKTARQAITLARSTNFKG